MKEKEKQPEFRFCGFTDPWEQRKLKEVARFNPKTELPERFEYIDLESVIGTQLIGHRTEERDSAPSRAQRLATPGDIFFQTVRPYQKNNYLFDISDGQYVFSTGYAQLKPTIDNRFLFSYIQRDDFVKNVLDWCTGTSYPAISSSDLSQISIMKPKNSIEQQSIGSFFSTLDHLITLQQRELDSLKSLKKTLLSKLFPKNAESFPGYRFQGFNDPWEQRKLGLIFEEFSKKTKEENEYPVLSSTNTGMEPREGRVSGKTNVGYKIIETGDLVLSPQNLWLGNININNLGTGLVSPSYKTYKIRKLISDFLKPQLKTDRMIAEYKYASTQGASVVRRNLDLDRFNEIQLSIPGTVEQQSIGTFFSTLDHLITLQQRELEILKAMKKTWLKKLFP